MTPIVWETLKELDEINLPESTVQKFRENVSSNTFKAVLHTAEIVKIIRTLNQEDIQIVPLKGVVLSQTTYGSLARRYVGDIDLLLNDPESIWRTEDIILNMGYQRFHPDFQLSPRQKKFLLNNTNQIVYLQPKLGILLEIHFNWSQNKHILPLSIPNMWKNTKTAKVADTEVRVINDDDNLHFLLVHGSKHAWSRLQWLYDIPMMMRNMSDVDMNLFQEKVEQLGTSRMVLQGMKLSDFYFATQFTERFSQTLINSKDNKFLDYIIPYARNGILEPEKLNTKTIPFTQKLIPIIRMIKYQTLLRSNFAYKAKELEKFLTITPDWKTIRLPDQLFFLYYVLRPFLWIIRLLQKK